MKILVPIEVTDSMLLSSTIPEADAAAWSSATTYAAAALVMRGHKVWQSAVGGNINFDPLTDDGTHWVLIGPTNRWKAFDEKPSTTSTATDSMTWVLRPGVWVSDLALISAVGSAARVRVIDSDDVTVLYDQELALPGVSGTSYHGWFFRDRGPVVEGDLVFEGLPRRLTGSIEVTVRGVGTVALGVLVLGVMHVVGGTLAGSTSDLVDYSRVSTDEFGNTAIVRRARARKSAYQVLVPTPDLPRVRALRERVSSVPVVCIGADGESMRSALLTYGLIVRMPIEIPGLAHTVCSIEITGFA